MLWRLRAANGYATNPIPSPLPPRYHTLAGLLGGEAPTEIAELASSAEMGIDDLGSKTGEFRTGLSALAAAAGGAKGALIQGSEEALIGLREAVYKLLERFSA